MKRTYLYFLVLLLAGTFVLQACRKEDNKPNVVLAVKNYYPNSGNAGTLVTIAGSGFTNSDDATVSFAGTVAEVINRNDTMMVVRAPQAGQSGKINLKAGEKTIAVGDYTYQELSVQSFFPLNGPAGMHIRISGAGFSSLNGPAEVLINGVKATVVSALDTLIVAEIPVDAGTGPITVKVDGKSSTGAAFRFQSITGIKPLTGAAGTKVTVKGSGFDELAAGNLVDFNGKLAEVVTATAGELVVIAPADVSTGPLSVTIAGQKTTGPAFTTVPPPQIFTVSPLSGPAGQEMTINGLYFSAEKDENVVKINGQAVAVKTAAGSKLTLTLPGGTGNGRIEIIVNDQPVQGPEFKDQNLGINTMLPLNGMAGTKVTLTGTGFSANAAENEVTFNGVAAVVESASENTLVVTAPAALSSGVVKVRRAALEAQSPSTFQRAGIMTLAGGPSAPLGGDMRGLVVDSKGNIFIADRSRNVVYKVTPAGVVSVFAGSGQYGTQNGTGTNASFSALNSIVIDAQDNLYVSDGGGGNANAIRKITPAGVVTTHKSGLAQIPGVLLLDKAGNLYVSQSYSGLMRIYPDGATDVTYRGAISELCRPAIDAAGNIYFAADDYEAFLGQYTAGGTGIYRWMGSSVGYQDGPAATALFSYGMGGLLIGADGNLLIFDRTNFAIRQYNLTTKEVSTVLRLSSGYADGSFEHAKMSFLTNDMASDKDGNIYILDNGNKALRKIFLR
ncbi:IPT/TIG domain-containing protein [uncultured Chitinophaga sp.]|uniref:IPT/TIG domain-containing protein n=1 Tax=uncultured Chitinophaga sp. TaxID=339340 RepID=UPI0025F38595|nr:IPT/TIG domain-containing protein [uncultured Chitinophaga sp.]